MNSPSSTDSLSRLLYSVLGDGMGFVDERLHSCGNTVDDYPFSFRGRNVIEALGFFLQWLINYYLLTFCFYIKLIWLLLFTLETLSQSQFNGLDRKSLGNLSF